MNRWMDRPTQRQAGVVAETAYLAPSPCTPQACAAQQVGIDRWQGLRAPVDDRCCAKLLAAAPWGHGASLRPLALMCRIQEEADTSAH